MSWISHKENAKRKKNKESDALNASDTTKRRGWAPIEKRQLMADSDPDLFLVSFDVLLEELLV